MKYNNIKKLKRLINYNELEDYIIYRACEYYDFKCSKDIEDYNKDMFSTCIDFIENSDGTFTGVYRCMILFEDNTKDSTCVIWYDVYSYDNKDNLDCGNYTKKDIYI